MAIEPQGPTVAAGELSGAFIGSKVRLVRAGDYTTAIIEDVLKEVRHLRDDQTTLFFEHTSWRVQSLLGNQPDEGATVHSDHRIEILNSTTTTTNEGSN